MLKPGLGVERRDFAPLLHGGRVSEKSLGVSTLQAAEPPHSVNNGPVSRLISKLSQLPKKKKLNGVLIIVP